MSKELELIRLSEANKLLLKSIVFLNGTDKHLIESIILSNKDLINEYNKSELTIINPTNAELGTISSSLKKIVLGYLGIKFIEVNREFSDRYNSCDCYNTKGIECEECLKEVEEDDKRLIEQNKLNAPIYELKDKILKACNNTKLSTEIKNAKILLSRKNPNSYKYDSLELQTNEYLKTKMLEQFIEQNSELVQTIIKENHDQN